MPGWTTCARSPPPDDTPACGPAGARATRSVIVCVVMQGLPALARHSAKSHCNLGNSTNCLVNLLTIAMLLLVCCAIPRCITQTQLECRGDPPRRTWPWRPRPWTSSSRRRGAPHYRAWPADPCLPLPSMSACWMSRHTTSPGALPINLSPRPIPRPVKLHPRRDRTASPSPWTLGVCLGGAIGCQ